MRPNWRKRAEKKVGVGEKKRTQEAT